MFEQLGEEVVDRRQQHLDAARVPPQVQRAENQVVLHRLIEEQTPAFGRDGCKAAGYAMGRKRGNVAVTNAMSRIPLRLRRNLAFLTGSLFDAIRNPLSSCLSVTNQYLEHPPTQRAWFGALSQSGAV